MRESQTDRDRKRERIPQTEGKKEGRRTRRKHCCTSLTSFIGTDLTNFPEKNNNTKMHSIGNKQLMGELRVGEGKGGGWKWTLSSFTIPKSRQ